MASDADGGEPTDRRIHAIGEAKAGERVGTRELQRLEEARASLSVRAAHAKLILFAPAFAPDLIALVRARPDGELTGARVTRRRTLTTRSCDVVPSPV